MHGFIYEWSNTLNGLKYLGRHQGTPDDGYIGSGTVFRNSYNKHPETFIRTILWESNNTSSEELKSKEEEFLNVIPDDELYYGANRKYYNQVRNSSGYTSEENPMRNPEVAARMIATKTAEGTLSNPYKNTVTKYGIEGAKKINSYSKLGNTYASGNKGSTKSANHKDKIAASIAKMYADKKDSDKYVAPTGRRRTTDYSIIILTVQQKGFRDAAKELNLTVSALKGRYYNAVSKLKD
jgi:hypothetical protein